MHTATKTHTGPVKLGVTGGVGSGKSVVCQYLAQKGFTVVSADDLARQSVMPGASAYQNIVNHFGSTVLFDNGELDRKKLRWIITQDPEKKRMLENFIHPEVFRLMEIEFQGAAQRKEPAVIVEVPLLFEANLKHYFDLTLTVYAEKEVRIQRIMARDLVSHENAEALLGIQMPDEEKIKQSDFIINNNGTTEDLHVSMDQFYKIFMDRLKTAGNKNFKRG